MKFNSRRVLFVVVAGVVVFNAVQFWRAPQADTRRIAQEKKLQAGTQDSTMKKTC